MKTEDAKTMLAAGAVSDEPVFLPPAILGSLTSADLPPDTFVEVGTIKDGVRHIEWGGRLYCEDDQIVGEADYTWTRKYWYEPIGLEQYLDLVKRGVEIRQKTHGDVELTNFEDDGAFIQLSFSVSTREANLGRAYDAVRKVCSELEETSEQISAEIGKQIASIAARVSVWGS
jgi:hypothetical protein